MLAWAPGESPPDIPLAELVHRGFDIEAFVDEIEPSPLMLADPSAEYLAAAEIMPLLTTLAKY